MTTRRNKRISEAITVAVAPPEIEGPSATPSENATALVEVKDLPPDPEKMNDKRAAAAERALISFAADFGELVEDEDFTSQNLGDLLANLAHLCDRKGLDFGELLEKAAGYYKEETDNEGRQFEKIN